MATLHTTTVLTKKIALWGGIAICGLIFLIFTIRAGKTIKNFLFPPGPPPPTVLYGKLPAPDFPKNVIGEKLSYSIYTISGVLPSFPGQLKVYPISSQEPSLLNLQRARQKARSIGFNDIEKKVNDVVYKWTDESPLSRIFIMNITNQNFALTTQYTTNPSVVNGVNIPDENGATELAKSFLESLNLLPSDIDITKTAPILYSLKNGLLIPATSLSTTQIIGVDFYQKDIDTIPMYYPHPPHSTISFLIGGGNGPTILDAKFTHPIISDKGATYPSKPVDQAFQELKDGKAYIATFDGTTPEVKITDVTLGYYISVTTQEYITPIIVFHGDNNFLAYISAIPPQWIQ